MDINIETLEKIVEEVHSSVLNTRKKLKLHTFNESLMIVSEKPWFVKRSITSISVEQFFELIFKEAFEKKRLDFSTKTISFDETDGQDLNVSVNTSISIFEFFKMIPDLK